MSLKKQLSAAHSGAINPADMRRKTIWRVVNLDEGWVHRFPSRDAAQRYAGTYASRYGVNYTVDRDGDYVLFGDEA